jgi:hypothetical protein
MEAYVFLDPDGTRGVGLTVVVARKTGVTYAHQCAGFATETRELEGFAVPLGGEEVAAPLLSFFRRFKDSPPKAGSPSGEGWTQSLVADLGSIVSNIPFWHTDRDQGTERRLHLDLDVGRLSEFTEGWIPVRTGYGPGVLLCNNND